jgi:hypothetical protein
MQQRKNGDDEVARNNDSQEGGRKKHYLAVNGGQKCDQSAEEKEEGGMQKKWYDFYHCVHIEPLEAVVQERDYPGTDNRGRGKVCPVHEIPSPLFQQSGNEGAGETEAQTDEPQSVADQG